MPKNSAASRTKRSNHLMRKLILIFLISVDSALGIGFLFNLTRVNEDWDNLVLFSVLLGLTSGLASRIILRKRNAALRFLAALSSLSLGLVVLGLFSRWRIGIGPLYAASSGTDWMSLLQIALAAITAVLIMNAWHQHTAQGRVAVGRKGTPSKTHRVEGKRKGNNLPGAGTIVKDHTRSPRSPAGRKTSATSRSRHALRPGLKSSLKKGSGSTRSRSIPRSGRRKRKVQLTAKEEHRCPYCLELVRPDDSRGIVECQVCHTLHHADCWAITGTCQVPHLTR